MERTPSPPRRSRLHTPPAPRYGAKYDEYEPYSPRRSERIAANLTHELSPPRVSLSRTSRALTPTRSSKKKVAAHAPLQALSPPSSPSSDKHQSAGPAQRNLSDRAALDSDSDHLSRSAAHHLLSTMEPGGMLPTPAKTPRKRLLHSEQALKSTSRVLFAPRPAIVEDVMPTPHKSRKNLNNVFSLESFAEQTEQGGDKIEIYTDSKERIPTAVSDEESPFFIRKSKGKARAKSNGPTKQPKTDAKSEKMQEAVNRDEGIIYNFRGRRILRKFEDVTLGHAPENELVSSGDELQRQAGVQATRRLTRSSIKPRLLFQEDIKKRNREMGLDDVEEEESTDIEIATPSGRKARKGIQTVIQTGISVEPAVASSPVTTRAITRNISFDSWSRVKSSASSTSDRGEGKKRRGEPLEGPSDKRIRSEPSSAISMDSV